MVEPTDRQRTNQEVVALLAELGNKQKREEDIVHEGSRFVLPVSMTDQECVDFLTAKILEDEKPTNFRRKYNFRPWDGAFCTYNALKKAFGMVRFGNSFFGGEMITLETGVGETTEIPWGQLRIPPLPGVVIQLGGTYDEEYGTVFEIVVTGPRKYRAEIDGLFKIIEDELKNFSLYRGRAIDGKEMPGFLDLSGVDPAKVTYSREVMTQLQANVWNLIRHTDRVEKMGLPLKRSVLIEGPYGTGKTLAAFLTAQESVANGWTFLLARPAKDSLEEVMRTARLYQPAVVFMEDLDTVPGAGGDDDKDAVTKMLDLFDGVQAKGTKLIVIMTTNHKEKINKAMVRPGRLDAVIHIGQLDRDGVERLIRSNIKDPEMIEADVDFDVIFEHMLGYTPAFVKEAGDRAIHYALGRGDETIRLTTADFVDAADGLRDQLNLLNDEQPEEAVTLDVAFSKAIERSVDNGTGKKIGQAVRKEFGR